MAEKLKERSIERSTIIVILILIILLVGVIIAIPITYSVGRIPAKIVTAASLGVDESLINNECTQPLLNFQPLDYILNQEPFPYKIFSYIYRPSVVTTKMSLIFGFRHDSSSWSLDQIMVNDTSTKTNIMVDGGFESNYLLLNYGLCILSSTRSASSDILFNLPYEGDFYYNDQTVVGGTYLSQQLDVIGGRYYNISFYLENRGFATSTPKLTQNNSVLIFIGY